MVESVEELKKICHNNARFTDRPWWYRLYRAVSIRVTCLILLTGIKVNPNYVTALEAIAGVLGALLLLSSNQVVVLIGFFLLYSAYLFDCVDGELARYYQKFSSAGSYMDEVGHAIVDPLLFVVLTLSLYSTTPSTLLVIIGFLTAFLIRFIKANYQLNAFIFVKELTSSPKVFLSSESNIDLGLDQSSKVNGGLRSKTISKIMAIVNSIKHLVVTVTIIFVAFLLDYLKSIVSNIPALEYRMMVLVFYSIFLSLVAVVQVYLNIRNIDQEKIKIYREVKEAMKVDHHH